MNTSMIKDKDLLRFGYAPGGYMFRCLTCNATGLTDGDKRATCCRDCAIKRLLEEQRSPTLNSKPIKPGELLALCREMKGLSLREVEAITGLSNARISQIENGAEGFSFQNAVKLCDVYGIALDRLAKTVREK